MVHKRLIVRLIPYYTSTVSILFIAYIDVSLINYRDIFLFIITFLFTWYLGEFTTVSMKHEGFDPSSDSESGESLTVEGVGRQELLLGRDSSIYTFTRAFQELAFDIQQGWQSSEPKSGKARNSNLITIDGGPHTLWW